MQRKRTQPIDDNTNNNNNFLLPRGATGDYGGNKKDNQKGE